MTRTFFKQPIAPDAICEVDGCETRPRAIGLCHKHYVRMHRYGSTDSRKKVYAIDRTKLGPIGCNLLALRLRHGFSNAILAQRAGLHSHTIWHIGRGGSCNLDTLRTIASVFNVEVWELLKPDHFPLTEDVQR